MEKKCLSGAQKRKLAEEKKQKNDALLKKIPKLTQLFSATVQISSNNTENNESETDTNENSDINIENDNEQVDEIQRVRNEENQCDENEEDRDSSLSSNVSASSSINNSSDLSETVAPFSSDAGLWDVHHDISVLQRYWIKQGKYDIRFVILHGE